MKHKMHLLAIVLLTLLACSKEYETDGNNEFETSNSIADKSSKKVDGEIPDEHLQIKLGEQLQNPYAVKSMQEAFDYYNATVEDSPFKGRKVKASHNYIEITPSTERHRITLDKLDNSDEKDAPVLNDYPLDYKIVQEGDYYVEPKDVKDLYYSAYTVVPVDYKLPGDLPYKILAELYEPTEKEFDVETTAMVFADWKEDLEADFERPPTRETLPKFLNASAQQQRGWFGKRFRPQGHVKVENTDSHVYDPLQKAKISIGRSFWWKYTYTTNTGYFSSPKKYRGKVRIRAKWRGYTATIRKTWNELLGFWVSDHLMTLKRNHNNKTKYIAYSEPHTGIFGVDLVGGHLWFKGTTHNGLRKYVDYANANGIDKSTSYANVWAFASGSSSSTPMLYKYPQLPGMASIAGIGQSNLWHAMTQYVAGSGIGLTPWWLRPDHIFQNLKGKKINDVGQSNTVRIHQLVFHESGHYSHALKAGSWFWANIFATELSNSILEDGPYDDGSKPSFQAGRRIALAEGWATFAEFKVTTFHYDKAYMVSQADETEFRFYDAQSPTFNPNEPSVERNMENFDVFDVPMAPNTRWDDRSWFLHGIMWDLFDARNEIRTTPTSPFTFSRHHLTDGTAANNIVDNIGIGSNNLFDLSYLFDNLTGNVHSACDLQFSLLSNISGLDGPIIEVFQSYGYNCALP
jgi:hypothetical protein